MQALNEHERTALEEFGVECPIEVIPNGVNPELLAMPRSRETLEREFPDLRGKRSLLFLGRLWKEKGLDLLLSAWDALREFHREWTLVLAGPNYRGYATELEQHAKKVGSVLMVGMVTGSRKAALLAGSDAFSLPSRGEGFSMALIEALASGIPAIYTMECNFPDAAQAGAGIETDRRVDALAEGLARVLSMDDAKRIEMGCAGRKLVARNYTWDVIAGSLMDLYERISDHHPKI
jgi:glycosyltransferase involved in cell wall biosynthesis